MRIPFLVIVVSYTISILGLLIISGIDANGKPYQMTIFDAFYFVTYTATTIGFGETPFAFTYNQRLWVSIMIYISVISWFYAIGSLINLLQDKLLILQIKENKFKRQVKNLKEGFIIVLGYSNITNRIIKRINKTQYRVVVIENNQTKINNLILDNHTPHIPVLKANSFDAYALQSAGIKSKYCRAIVSLYKNDDLNLRISLTAKILNSNVFVVAKSTTANHTSNLKDLGVEIIENPFKITAFHFLLALNSPNLLKLEKWIYQIGMLNDSLPTLPKGKYIICGFGRMGLAIFNVFNQNNIDCEFIEINKDKYTKNCKMKNLKLIHGNSDDENILNTANIKNSVAIIAGTNSDTVNISILKTAKKINPNIVTIARENHIEDFPIFKNAKIDHIIMPSEILINKTSNALIRPTADKFIRSLSKQNEQWGQSLVKKLVNTINENPMLHTQYITQKKTPTIIEEMSLDKKIKLSVFSFSLSNRNQTNNIVPLMIYNEDSKEEILLPSWDYVLKKRDKILFACDEWAINEIKLIAKNKYEFYYILNGYEKSYFQLKNK